MLSITNLSGVKIIEGANYVMVSKGLSEYARRFCQFPTKQYVCDKRLI